MIEFDLSVRRGEFDLRAAGQFDAAVTGVFGPSGAGKSTLLHVFAGLVRPTSGRLTVEGRVLIDTERGVELPAHQRHVGVVFQDARLFPHYSVKGNLRFGRNRRGGKGEIAFDEVVSLLELGPMLGRPVRTLSGGEGQRVALGRALLSSPRLLLLDEPMAALDRGLKQQILPFLQRVRDAVKIPMVYVSHDLRELLQLTDRMLVLDGGHVTGSGRYGDLVLDPNVWAGDPELVNVHPARVQAHDESLGLTRVELMTREGEHTGAVLRAGYRAGLLVEQRVSVSLRPEDVALSLQPVDHISIQNQIPGKILRVSRYGGQAMLEIDVGAPLLAQVTECTMEAMGLREGMDVVCLVKSNAIRLLNGRG